MIRSMLEQQIVIRVGKFESDRLSLEVRRLKDALNGRKHQRKQSVCYWSAEL